MTQGQVTASGAWNLDFWGRYRRATESARATLLANQWAQKEVMATLVASVASDYFQLRQLDLELEISERTLGSRHDSLDLTKTLEHGITPTYAKLNKTSSPPTHRSAERGQHIFRKFHRQELQDTRARR